MATYPNQAERQGRRRRRGFLGRDRLEPSAGGWLHDVMTEDRDFAALSDVHFQRRGVEVRPATSGPDGAFETLDAMFTAPQRHGVHFYDNDEAIVASVADSFSAPLARGDKLLVVATAEHLMAVEEEMQTRGLRPGAGSYHAYDAEEMLESLLLHGAPDRDRFLAVVGSVVRELRSGGPLTIYGEMVNLLWEQGDVIAAMRLEGFWNELAADIDFSLLCGYRTDAQSDTCFVGAIGGLHSHVVRNS